MEAITYNPETTITSIFTMIGNVFAVVGKGLEGALPKLMPLFSILTIFLVLRYGKTIINFVKGMFSSNG